VRLEWYTITNPRCILVWDERSVEVDLAWQRRVEWRADLILVLAGPENRKKFGLELFDQGLALWIFSRVARFGGRFWVILKTARRPWQAS
jgi:hypothetical protein